MVFWILQVLFNDVVIGTGQTKACSSPAEGPGREHIPPKGCQYIRRYGLYASRTLRAPSAGLPLLLGLDAVESAERTPWQIPLARNLHILLR